jgi:hypothetical protein
LDKEGAAIGAHFGPGDELEFAVRASKDENQSALEAGFGLIVGGRPATGTHHLAALWAQPICIVHRGMAGGAAVQFCQIGREMKLDGERPAFGLLPLIFPFLGDKVGPAVRACLVFGR